MNIRNIEAAIRRASGDVDPAAQKIATAEFSLGDVLLRAAENCKGGLSVQNAVSEACDAYGHDYDRVMAAIATPVDGA